MKKRIRILFYRAKIGDKHWLDDAISLWTGIFNWGTGPYSHVELWVPDRNGDFYRHAYDHLRTSGKKRYIAGPYGDCYTSTMRGGAKGVCKRPANEVLKNPKRFDYAEFDISEKLYNRMIKVAEWWVKHNKGYDKKAIASFFWYKRIHDAAKWICSEFVYFLLVAAGVFRIRSLCPSPRRLSRWITKKGVAIKPLVKGK